jgi:hypothetical protein
MRRLFVAAGVAGIFAILVPLAGTASAGPIPEEVPAACILVDQPPLHLQVGYSPNGPSDCTPVP